MGAGGFAPAPPAPPHANNRGFGGRSPLTIKENTGLKEIESRIKCSVRGNFLNENSNHNTWILNT